MTGFGIKLIFAYRRPSCPGFQKAFWDGFEQTIYMAFTAYEKSRYNGLFRKALNSPLTENIAKKRQVEQALAEEIDAGFYITKFCDIYASENYNLAKAFNVCTLYRNGKQYSLPINWGLLRTVSETSYITSPNFLALYERQRLASIEGEYRDPEGYAYRKSPDDLNFDHLLNAVTLYTDVPSASMGRRYHSGFDCLEGGTPDGLGVDFSVLLDPNDLRKSSKRPTCFFDVWPEIPEVYHPLVLVSKELKEADDLTFAQLLVKNPQLVEQYKTHVEAFLCPEAYYEFAIGFSNTFTKNEIIFPEIRVKLSLKIAHAW